MNNETKDQCCKEFNPDSLDGKEINLNGRKFLKKRYACFFHVPINIGQVMKQTCAIASEAQAMPEDALWLCDENSPWGADLYLEINKDLPGQITSSLDGIYLCKIFDGPYKEMPKWIEEMKEFVEKKGKKTDKILAYYTTCPKCSKKYGHNYVGLLAKIS